MPRSSIEFHCAECGAIQAKWSGRCDTCGQWNTIHEVESDHAGNRIGKTGFGQGKAIGLSSLVPSENAVACSPTGISELDRVLGGGLVAASAVLVGGDPGIGKSTLLLQAAAACTINGSAVYCTGEEACAQVQMRAARLGISNAPVGMIAETNLDNILATLASACPDVAIIDSIQTMWSSRLENAPGSLAQVRAVTHDLVRFAKKTGTVVLLVGHVTKEGQIAGPRVIEHAVDTVLYFEGERGHGFRILRAAKNRFGPVDEIGVFEMSSTGLKSVTNPSALFISERGASSPGSSVFAGIEGTRPLLVEIQALVSPSAFSTPRRNVVGWDIGRSSMILAVLEARCGLSFVGHDVYLNIAGGLKIAEPAADLAVAGALASSLLNICLPDETVMFGEISLSGTIRPVPRSETRLREASKLGFTSAVMPEVNKPLSKPDINARRFRTLAEFIEILKEAGEE